MHYAEGSLMNWLVMKLVFMTIPRQPMPFFVRPIARKLCATVQAKLIDPNLKSAMAFIEDAPGEEHLVCRRAPDAGRLPDELRRRRPALARQRRRQCPHIAAWLKRVEARPAWQRGIAKGGPVLMAA
jgi:glutathione S-transferase